MVANQVEIERTPASIVLDTASLMESVAAKGEWQRTEQLAMQLRRAVLDIPEGERRSLIVAVRQSLERVQTMALGSRAEVTDKLSEIRRGRVAARAYGQPVTEVSRE